jgi:hypothetical protein
VVQPVRANAARRRRLCIVLDHWSAILRDCGYSSQGRGGAVKLASAICDLRNHQVVSASPPSSTSLPPRDIARVPCMFPASTRALPSATNIFYPIWPAQTASLPTHDRTLAPRPNHSRDVSGRNTASRIVLHGLCNHECATRPRSELWTDFPCLGAQCVAS